jgi:hypothetical protein
MASCVHNTASVRGELLFRNGCLTGLMPSLQGDDTASVGHGTHRSSGSTDGHPAYVAGLEPICEAQMQVSTVERRQAYYCKWVIRCKIRALLAAIRWQVRL